MCELGVIGFAGVQKGGNDGMDDLISRQWLIECVNERWIKFDTEKDENRFIHLVRDIAPSVQPERKTGKWIKHAIGHEHTPWGFDCSECGEWFVVGEEVIKKYNYCPNCGSYNGEQP